LRSIKRYLPSRPVIASVIVSLVVGGVGSATAASLITGKQIKNGSIQYSDLSKKAKKKLRGKRGKTGAAGVGGAKGDQGAKGDPGASATKLWAAVDGDPVTPTIVRGSGAVAVSRFGGAGQFKVKFDRDVRDCAWIATVGDPSTDGSWSSISSRSIATSFSTVLNQSDEVLVETSNTTTNVNQDFFIAVFC
jgi:hypothetical protein